MEAATRPYRMGARAEAVAATRRSITDAWLTLFAELHYDEITLEKVAARASTTVQTVIRHFGSKGELSAAAFTTVADDEMPRRTAPVGDVAAAVRLVVAHYDRAGTLVLRGLEQEDRFPTIARSIQNGRKLHYRWVKQIFAPFLEARTGRDRRRLHAQLVVLTDIYTWKLLRRDQGLGKRQTEVAMTEMINAVIRGGGAA